MIPQGVAPEHGWQEHDRDTRHEDPALTDDALARLVGGGGRIDPGGARQDLATRLRAPVFMLKATPILL